MKLYKTANFREECIIFLLFVICKGINYERRRIGGLDFHQLIYPLTQQRIFTKIMIIFTIYIKVIKK